MACGASAPNGNSKLKEQRGSVVAAPVSGAALLQARRFGKSFQVPDSLSGTYPRRLRMRSSKKTILLITSLVLVIAVIQPSSAETEAIEFVKDMGVGWNLGNTLEACGGWINKSSIRNFETAWGNPVTEKEIFRKLKDSGIRTVRIPVAWSNLMGEDNRINPELMDRVETVVDSVLDEGMYAIVNLHWDGGWIKKFPTQNEECSKKYEAIWEQVSKRFRDKSNRLIFESMNEEGYFDDIWNRYGPKNEEAKKKAYDLLNRINQDFVNIVRARGGNNNDRYLLIAGYATDIDLTCDPDYQLPSDPANHLIVSVHYYSPPNFAILETDASWGKAQSTWGTEEDKERLGADFKKLKKRFIDKGIPVILGEYGCTSRNKDKVSVNLYLRTVASTAVANGVCPLLWDAGGEFDRRNYRFRDKEVEAYLSELSEKTK